MIVSSRTRSGPARDILRPHRKWRCYQDVTRAASRLTRAHDRVREPREDVANLTRARRAAAWKAHHRQRRAGRHELAQALPAEDRTNGRRRGGERHRCITGILQRERRRAARIEGQAERHAAGEPAQRIRQVAQTQRGVAAEEFGPCLFDERGPQLARHAAPRMQRHALCVARQTVIYGERHPCLTHKDLQREHTKLAAAHGDEEARQLLVARGERRQRTYEPAIAGGAWSEANICGRHAVGSK